MGGIILGSLLMRGALLSAFGVLDGGGDNEPDPEPDPDQETIEGGSGDDLLAGAGNDLVFSYQGDDAISLSDTATGHGGEGDDTLSGLDDSVLYGGLGTDDLDAEGSSTAYGGADGDHLVGSDDAVLYGGGGNDDLHASDNATIYGDDGNDDIALHVFGEPISTLADGGAGNDHIAYPVFDDSVTTASTLSGGEGDDWLASPYVNDELLGGAGNDVLIGANGVEMTGGTGADRFVAAGTTVITDYTAGDDQLEVFLPQGEWLEGMTMTSEVVNGSTVIRFDFDQSAGNYPGQSGSAPEDFTITLQGVTDFDSNGLIIADSDGAYEVTNGTSGDDVINAQGTVVVEGGAGDDVITSDAGGHVSGGDGDDVIIRNLKGDSEPGAHISGTYGGAGDDIIVLGNEGNSQSDDGGDSYDTYGGAGNDVFMIDPAGFEDGAYVEIFDYRAGDEIVILIDPAQVVSAEWSAVIVDTYHGYYRYYLDIQMVDGTSLSIKVPSNGDDDPYNPPTFPVTFDASAADGLTA